MALQVIDVAEDAALAAEYGGRAPCVLAHVAGRWAPIKLPAPRLSADALGLRLQAEIGRLEQEARPR